MVPVIKRECPKRERTPEKWVVGKGMHYESELNDNRMYYTGQRQCYIC
jgi:hypothetical protein